MHQILIYSDSRTWGIIPNTRAKLGIALAEVVQRIAHIRCRIMCRLDSDLSQYASPGWPSEQFSGPKPLLAGNQVTIKLRLVVGGGANSQGLGGEGAAVQVLAKK